MAGSRATLTTGERFSRRNVSRTSSDFPDGREKRVSARENPARDGKSISYIDDLA